eukprot:EG_transcript_34269
MLHDRQMDASVLHREHRRRDARGCWPGIPRTGNHAGEHCHSPNVRSWNQQQIYMRKLPMTVHVGNQICNILAPSRQGGGPPHHHPPAALLLLQHFGGAVHRRKLRGRLRR